MVTRTRSRPRYAPTVTGLINLAWLRSQNATLLADPSLPDRLGGARLSVGYAIIDEPPFEYHLAVADGTARLQEGLGDGALVFRGDRDTVEAVYNGSRTSQDLILSGDLRIDGDATILLAHRPALDAIRSCLIAGQAAAPA